MVDTLPLTTLVGAVAGLLSLQASREMTVIKSAGVSVWRLMQAPVAVTLLGGLLVAVVLDPGIVILNRSISPSPAPVPAAAARLWLDERRGETRYMLEAGYGSATGDELSDVTVFMMDSPRDRIEAPAATLAERQLGNAAGDALPLQRTGRSHSAISACPPRRQ